MKTMTRISAVLLVVVVLLTACQPQEVEQPLDEVTVQLKWVHQAQFAGFYAADQKGFYAEENIDVTLNPGGLHLPPATIISDLVDGKSAFAIVGGEQLLAARHRGQPVVAIAVVFQKNPYTYVSLEGSGIERPQDLVGKKVMVVHDAEIQHQALLRKLGIDPEDIEHIPYERDVAPLTTGQIDAQLVYRTGLGLAYDETGYDLNWMWVDDYGIHLYADTIITHEDLIQRDPELVERFLRATLRGWRYAIENQAEAVDLTLQYDPTLTRDRQARMMATQTPLIHTGKTKLGWMDRGVWEGMQDILLEQRVLAAEDIKKKAQAVAQQMADYINSHPDMTLKELQDDPRAQEIAVQQLGETGYTVVADATTGMAYFHSNPEVVGEDPEESRKAFPAMWEIIDRTIGSPCQDASGFYEWGVEGEIREKYTHLVCVDARTADGIRLFVGGSTYLDDYELTPIEIDEAFTMQFLNQIYSQAE